MITSIELNHKTIDCAKKGQEVCVKIEPIPGESPKMYGRHFEATDMIVSKVRTQRTQELSKNFHLLVNCSTRTLVPVQIFHNKSLLHKRKVMETVKRTTCRTLCHPCCRVSDHTGLHRRSEELVQRRDAENRLAADRGTKEDF